PTTSSVQEPRLQAQPTFRRIARASSLSRMDSRIEKLARLLINHSCQLRPGEKVLIEAIDAPADILSSLIRQATAAGATPLISIKQQRLMSELCSAYSVADIQLLAECELEMLKRVDAFISIRAVHNPRDFESVPKDK